jgi:hypothetical protein
MISGRSNSPITIEDKPQAHNYPLLDAAPALPIHLHLERLRLPSATPMKIKTNLIRYMQSITGMASSLYVSFSLPPPSLSSWLQ